LNSPEPDVLWLEVAGGWMFDSRQESSGVYRHPADAETENLLLLVMDADSGEYCYLSAAVRVVLLGEGNKYLLMHALTPAAFANPADPDWAGILGPGHEYLLALDDPHWPGIEYEFEDRLNVIGSNPNDA